MPNTPNSSSFIPKQGPVRQVRQTATRQIQALSVIAYIAIGAAAVASVASFFYNMHIKNQLAVEAQNLTQAMSDFKTEDMERVREFNMRLSQARQRLDSSASVSAVLSALEAATIGTVMIESLNVKREGDTSLLLDAQLATDTFDSALFQRGVLERSFIAETVVVEDLSLNVSPDVETGATGSSISINTKIVVPVERVINRQGEQFGVSSQSEPIVPAPVDSIEPDLTEEISNESSL